MTINNIPEYATYKLFIVARESDGELWFWGAWDDEDKANEVALEIEGYTFDWSEIGEDEKDWDDEPSDWDREMGFDPYEGCYTWDC